MPSIQKQITVTLIGGTLLLFGMAGFGLYVFVDEALLRGADASLNARAQAIAGAVYLEDDNKPHFRPPDPSFESTTGRESPYYFQIWRADGTLVEKRVPEGTTPFDLPQDGAEGEQHFTNIHLPDGTSARAVMLTFRPQPDADEFDAHPPVTRPSEILSLTVAQDRRGVDRPAALLLYGLLTASAVVTVGIIILVAVGVRRGLRPLIEVSAMTDRIGASTLDLRFPEGNQIPIELQPIGQKLNDLLKRLQAAFERERRFSSAAAHELRTPLAELTSLCEVSLRWPDDSAGLQAAVAESLNIAHEMTTVVQDLFRLARAGAGAVQLNTENVNVVELVERSWSKYQAAAAGRSVTMRMECASELVLATDRGMLETVLNNLFANVSAHATEGGEARVEARYTTHGIQITIRNSCEVLEPADMARIGEPFWRKANTRTDDNHAGLGLAIADAYCRQLHIVMDAKLIRPNWFAVTLSSNGANPRA